MYWSYSRMACDRLLCLLLPPLRLLLLHHWFDGYVYVLDTSADGHSVDRFLSISFCELRYYLRGELECLWDSPEQHLPLLATWALHLSELATSIEPPKLSYVQSLQIAKLSM